MRHVVTAARLAVPANAQHRRVLNLSTAALVFAIVLCGLIHQARAADLPKPHYAPPVVVEETGLCTIAAASGFVEVFQEPLGESSGFLPAGMIVEVIDAPYTRYTDLWVRIKPPRINNYYGWVETSRFVCI